jgi:hypothetical protein
MKGVTGIWCKNLGLMLNNLLRGMKSAIWIWLKNEGKLSNDLNSARPMGDSNSRFRRERATS